jgi:hypothetical protein
LSNFADEFNLADTGSTGSLFLEYVAPLCLRTIMALADLTQPQRGRVAAAQST